MQRAAASVRELPDGIALTFAAGEAVFRDLAEWASLERRCCPFLAFTLDWKDDDEVTVRLTGGPGVKEAIAAEMGLEAGRR